jgi:hypothetical protein
MGMWPFGMRFQKFDQFRNSDILHITKVRFSEDVEVGVEILSSFVLMALRLWKSPSSNFIEKQ